MKKRILILACALALLVSCTVMLTMAADTTHTAYCEYCETDDVVWEPIVFGTHSLAEGEESAHKHFYFDKDYTHTSAKQLLTKGNVTVCVDLNGHSWYSYGRAFYANYTTVNEDWSIINIQDSKGGAVVTSRAETTGYNSEGKLTGTNNTGGANIWVAEKCTVNIYGGTFKLDAIESEYGLRVDNGGIASVCAGATLNVFGGTLEGGNIKGYGGAVFLYNGSALNAYGGIIKSGNSANGTGDAVGLQKTTVAGTHKVTLGGDAQVDEIYFAHNTPANFVVDGTYTGKANLSYNTTNVTNLAVGTTVGALTNNGSVADADIYCTNGDGYSVVADGTALKLAEPPEEDVRYECAHCKQTVKWEVFTTTPPASAGTYHYYLDKDYSTTTSPAAKQYTVANGALVCIDLNGHSYETNGRAMGISNNSNAVLSIMDTVGTGVINGTSGSNNPGGGTISVGSATTFNLYSGTLKFTRDDTTTYGTGRGGVIQASGTLNVYGGKIVGGEMVDSTYESFNTLDGVGGAIYASSVLNIQGGEITSGSVPESGAGPCIYIADGSTTAVQVTLGGDAKVDDIYFTQNVSTRFTVDDDFTGTAKLSYAPEVSLYQGLVVGTYDASGWNGSISCSSTAYPSVLPVDGNLALSAYPAGTVAATGGQGYTSAQAAINAAAKGAVVELLSSVTGDLTVSQDICLQLNGCTVSGTVTVADGATLYGMDSATADYTVADGKYGKLTKVVGTVKGVSVDQGTADDSYLMVTESDGVSFHCVTLQIYAMTLRVTAIKNEPGLYYKSNFHADEVAAPLLASYGVALSVKDIPNAGNLDSQCKYSAFDGFESGPVGNLGNTSSTLLSGIMKNGNTDAVNTRNMNMTVYGRAYAKTTDGQLIFGTSVSRTLLEQLEGVDAMMDLLSSTQTKAAIEMYAQFKTVLADKELTNIATASDNNETGTLKVLVLGNSHGLDATNLLYEVFYQEQQAGNCEQDVLIAALYYSGCQVYQHKNFLSSNQKAYTYHKNDGSKTNRGWTVVEATCLDALQDEQWDIILMQQMNTQAGLESQYKAANWQYVADYLLNNQDIPPILGFHMTWANPDNYELYLNDDAPYKIGTGATGVTNWRNNHQNYFPDPETGLYEQDVMYAEIMRLTQKYLVDSTDWLGKDYFDERYIMNSATPVHYAQNVLGRTHEEIYRDYTHMNDYGRLICAYQWYAQLMGLEELTEVNVDAIPSNLKHKNSKFPAANADGIYAITDDMKADIIASVNWALKNPFSLPTE